MEFIGLLLVFILGVITGSYIVLNHFMSSDGNGRVVTWNKKQYQVVVKEIKE